MSATPVIKILKETFPQCTTIYVFWDSDAVASPEYKYPDENRVAFWSRCCHLPAFWSLKF